MARVPRTPVQGKTNESARVRKIEKRHTRPRMMTGWENKEKGVAFCWDSNSGIVTGTDRAI